MDGNDKPARTLELLDSLAALGFPEDSAFRIVHHFKVPATIAAHRKYCEDLQDEDGSFRTNTNRLVQRRLAMVLAMCQAGKLTNPLVAQFEHLAHIALLEFPHDRRPLHEQYLENDGDPKTAVLYLPENR